MYAQAQIDEMGLTDEENPIYQVYEIIGNAIERKETDKFTEHLKQAFSSYNDKKLPVGYNHIGR